jgi:glycosyltransferase involved in cell wall biosynthesis
MKVVHVTPYYPPELHYGGPPATVHELCGALSTAGVDVHVVTTTGTSAGDEPFDGVRVSRARRRTRFGFFAAIDSLLDRVLADANVCHVHSLFNWTAWRVAARARGLDRPTVVSPRGMLEAAALTHHARRKRVAWQFFDRSVLANATAIVAATADEAQTLRDRGFDSVVLPNGIYVPTSLPARGTFRASHGIPADAPVISYVGRLHPIKRLDLVADAFVRVASMRRDATLVVAGPDEAHLSVALRQRLDAFAGRVHFVGPVAGTEKWQLLVDSDTLVLCSDSESYGRVVAEALAAGVPPVVTDTCPWHVLEQERIGRFVPQRTEAMAAAIGELLSNASGRDQMGRRARVYAVTHLGWDRLVHRYIQMYESLARAPRVSALTAHTAL